MIKQEDLSVGACKLYSPSNRSSFLVLPLYEGKLSCSLSYWYSERNFFVKYMKLGDNLTCRSTPVNAMIQM